MGTKQALRAANSRVSELASGSPKKHLKGSGDSADGNDGATNPSETSPSSPACLPSPYSKITAPRRPQRYSSGHGSDNSSVLSGELPPAMGRTALFYHSGGSSGYESMIRDSETTGSASSAHDSMSESGVSTSSRTRASKSPKKRSNGKPKFSLLTDIVFHLSVFLFHVICHTVVIFVNGLIICNQNRRNRVQMSINGKCFKLKIENIKLSLDSPIYSSLK